MFGLTAGSGCAALMLQFPVAQSSPVQQELYVGCHDGGQGLHFPPQSRSLSSPSHWLFVQYAGLGGGISNWQDALHV